VLKPASILAPMLIMPAALIATNEYLCLLRWLRRKHLSITWFDSGSHCWHICRHVFDLLCKENDNAAECWLSLETKATDSKLSKLVWPVKMVC